MKYSSAKMEGRARSGLFVLSIVLASAAWLHVDAQQQGGVTQPQIISLVNALRTKGRYVTAATVISLITSSLSRNTTLLVPTDAALQNVNIAAIPQSLLPSLLQYHVLQKDLSFHELQLFPLDTWLPTELPGSYVQLTGNTPSNFSFNHVKVVDADLCPPTGAFIVCHGIDAILNQTSFDGITTPGQPVEAPAPATSPGGQSLPFISSPGPASREAGDPNNIAPPPSSAAIVFSLSPIMLDVGMGLLLLSFHPW